MIKPKDPRQLAVDLLPRSTCAVQVAAVLADDWGIFSWGWNSSGPTGYGEHAEEHCIKRSNGRRLGEAMIYVAAQRHRNGKMVTAKPCDACRRLIKASGVGIMYRDGKGDWWPA